MHNCWYFIEILSNQKGSIYIALRENCLYMTRARGIWEGVGWEHVTGAGDMWQGVEAGGM